MDKYTETSLRCLNSQRSLPPDNFPYPFVSYDKIPVPELKPHVFYYNGPCKNKPFYREQTVDQIYIYTLNNVIVSKNGHVEHVPDFKPKRYYRGRPGSSLKYPAKGICCYISQPGESCLGHAIIDILMKIWLLSKKYNDITLIFNHRPAGASKILRPIIKTFPCRFRVKRLRKTYFCDELVHINRLVIQDCPHKHLFLEMMDHIHQNIQDIYTPCLLVPSDKIYFSRKNWCGNNRELANIDDVEKVFIKHGFTIIHPEQYDLFKLIYIIRNCKCLAGERGSALHLSMFCKKLTTVLSLFNEKDKTALRYTQARLCEIQNQSCHYIYGQQVTATNQPDRYTYTINIRELDTYLQSIDI